jgi:hypothetical protein
VYCSVFGVNDWTGQDNDDRYSVSRTTRQCSDRYHVQQSGTANQRREGAIPDKVTDVAAL